MTEGEGVAGVSPGLGAEIDTVDGLLSEIAGLEERLSTATAAEIRLTLLERSVELVEAASRSLEYSGPAGT